jgi:uncharacterized damage-inducible protein DinB
MLLPEFDQEMAGCRRVLQRVPTAQFGFRPHPRSFTLGRLANHLASVPSWFVTAMATTELDFIDPKAAAELPLPATTTEGLVATFDLGVQGARAALAAGSDADFMTLWSGRSQGKVVFAIPRLAVYRTYIMNHMIHHRAQLTSYLRLLDLPVPALYGPSADES